MICTCGPCATTRRKVYKIKWPYPECPLKPWVGQHPMGSMSFDTWREAYDYARSPYYLTNYKW